jgi:hypothetical protein
MTNNMQWFVRAAPLFYELAATCFGSSLPSSGSLLDPSELLVVVPTEPRQSGTQTT